jgi:hypothetical protein
MARMIYSSGGGLPGFAGRVDMSDDSRHVALSDGALFDWPLAVCPAGGPHRFGIHYVIQPMTH